MAKMRAVKEAERILGLEDLRNDRERTEITGPDGEVLGMSPVPIAVVSDNGPCFRSEVFKTAFVGAGPLLRHVRTRVRSPQTNGAVERFFGTLKIRAPPPGRHRRRRCPGHGSPALPTLVQRRPTAPSTQRSDTCHQVLGAAERRV